MIEKYGYSSPAKNSEVKMKSKNTQFKNNDGVYAFNTNKQKDTMMSKYGSHSRLGSPEEIKKQQEIMMERYGVKTPTEHPEFLRKAHEALMERYGQIFNNSTISKVNLDLASKIEKAFNVTVEFEYNVESENIFFDLYIPKHEIVIDVNPTVTHNSNIPFACLRNKCNKVPCDKHKPLDKLHHYNRSLIAKDNNIRLIQVYDWESDDNILKMLKNKIVPVKRKYSARKLNLKEITQSEANKFLNLYHIQGASSKQIKCYGLFDDNELLSVATFGKARFKSKYEWEFIRYAVKDEVIIHGGSGRLIKKFIESEDPDNIVSYIDFNHTTLKDTFLNSSGFNEVESTGPRLVFHNRETNKMYPVTSLLMIGADRLLGTSYGSLNDSGLNNEEIMLKEGYLKVYTAGNRLFVWSK